MLLGKPSRRFSTRHADWQQFSRRLPRYMLLSQRKILGFASRKRAPYAPKPALEPDSTILRPVQEHMRAADVLGKSVIQAPEDGGCLA